MSRDIVSKLVPILDQKKTVSLYTGDYSTDDIALAIKFDGKKDIEILAGMSLMSINDFLRKLEPFFREKYLVFDNPDDLTTVLNYLDHVVFSNWLNGRKHPLFLIGSSSGAWRFAAVSQHHPVVALASFRKAYIHQHYDKKPSMQDVSREGIKILNSYLDEERIGEILRHPYLRLNIMAVRSKWPVTSDRWLLGTQL